MLRIPFEEMEQTICRAFIKAGLSENTAATCARIHTESSCDGVFSHGLNRVERFVDYLHRGWINPHRRAAVDWLGASLVISHTSIATWPYPVQCDGRLLLALPL